MVFSSTTFLFLFLPLVLLLYYNPLWQSRTFKNNFLLLASLGFYAWGEPVFVFLMLISILITWFVGLRLHKGVGRGFLALGIIYHVVVLFIFKYLTFALHEMQLLVGSPSGATVQIALPIGISFFTFQLMSYLFDIYYGKAEAQKNPLAVGLYVALFPQLIAGPIVRYDILPASWSSEEKAFSNFHLAWSALLSDWGKRC